jgi:hypothetical protein
VSIDAKIERDREFRIPQERGRKEKSAAWTFFLARIAKAKPTSVIALQQATASILIFR